MEFVLLQKYFLVPFAETWIDLETVIQSEVSQKVKQISYNIAYMWNLKKKKKSINYLQNRNTVTDGKKNKLMVTGR